MLEKLFLVILEISIASFPVILFLLIILPFLRKRYSPKLCCLLWLALAVRLILPLNMPWKHAIQIDLFPALQPQAAQYGLFLPNPAQMLELEPETESRNALPARESSRNTGAKITPVSLLAIVWASGMAIFLLYHLGAYFHTLHRLRRWSADIRDEETLRRFEAVRRELFIRRNVRLYSSSKAASPLLLGFMRPLMILPDQPLTGEQLDFMLRHELWHLRRGDLWYKLLILLANAVHWFNPLVWVMDRQAALDTELSCDADVLCGAGGDERTAYGYTMLSFLEQGWRGKTPLTSRFYGGKAQMKQRFSNIADTSVKKRGTALFCAAALMIALAGCTVHTAGPDGQAGLPAEKAKNIVQISVPLPDADRDILIRARIDDMLVAEDTFNPSDMDGGYWNPTIETDYTGEVLVRVYVDKKLYREILVDAGTNEQLADYTAKQYQASTPTPEDRSEIDEVYSILTWAKYPYTGGEMAWPFPDNTRIIAPFGENPQVPNNHHTGLDIAGELGDPVIAANNGTVMRVSEKWTPGVGYGMYIILDHGGETSTLYAHCSKILVSEGENVLKGRKIAEAGATGFAAEPHLHFEVRLSGVCADPMPYITSAGFVWPTDGGFVSEGFYSYAGHTGMDIAGIPAGSPVYAAEAGTVVKALDTNIGYGKHIIIDHGNGWQTLYAHNSELYVSAGDMVPKGQVIAAVGRSGHVTSYSLHFEIRHDGRVLDPEDFLTVPDESRQGQTEINPIGSDNPLDYITYEMS